MIDKIKSILNEYDDLLARQRFVLSVPSPSTRQFRSYFDWIRNKPPIVEQECQFIYHKDDILSLGPQTQTESWLSPLTDILLWIMPELLIKA